MRKWEWFVSLPQGKGSGVMEKEQVMEREDTPVRGWLLSGWLSSEKNCPLLTGWVVHLKNKNMEHWQIFGG